MSAEQPETILNRSEKPVTERVKLSRLGDLTTSTTQIVNEVADEWQVADRLFKQRALLQARFVMPVSLQEQLLDEAFQHNQMFSGNQPELRVNGRIPFVDPGSGELLAIYYLTMESHHRRMFRFPHKINGPERNIGHRQALQRYEIAGLRNGTRPIPENISIHSLTAHTNNGGIYDFTTGTEFGQIDRHNLAVQLMTLHQNCFAYAHDSSQASYEGQLQIIDSNPVAVAWDNNAGQIVGVGLLEGDDSFNFGVHLTEPTYYTDPAYQRLGLSTALRQEVDHLMDLPDYLDTFGPTIAFSESIRAVSLGASLRSGNPLAGTSDLRIDGDLGNTYTYIGPADPRTGLMPMGLTFNASAVITPSSDMLPDQYYFANSWIK